MTRCSRWSEGRGLTVDGMKTLPIGGRFMLKNPFLKIFDDGWLGLRVDQPSYFEIRTLDVPLLLGDILVMGDGDFSYSAALAKLYLEGDGEMHITATSEQGA